MASAPLTGQVFLPDATTVAAGAVVDLSARTDDGLQTLSIARTLTGEDGRFSLQIPATPDLLALAATNNDRVNVVATITKVVVKPGPAPDPAVKIVGALPQVAGVGSTPSAAPSTDVNVVGTIPQVTVAGPPPDLAGALVEVQALVEHVVDDAGNLVVRVVVPEPDLGPITTEILDVTVPPPPPQPVPEELCVLETDSCAMDRYDDPTIDFDNLDSGIGIPPDTAPGTTTSDYPYVSGRAVPKGVGVTFRGLSGGPHGVGGVDIAMQNESLNNKAAYLPCKNPKDEFKGACMSPTIASYYAARTFSASGNPWPSGLLVGNRSTDADCPQPCWHYWAKRIYRADLEFYFRLANDKTDLNYVRPRFTSIGEFPNAASGNGWNMTPDWGYVPARYVTNANVGRISGVVYAAPGVRDGSSRLVFSIFNADFPTHAVTTTGKPLGSFFSGADAGTGSWTTGALYASKFNVTVKDKSTGHWCVFKGRSVLNLNVVMNFTLSLPHLGTTGYSSCWDDPTP